MRIFVPSPGALRMALLPAVLLLFLAGSASATNPLVSATNSAAAVAPEPLPYMRIVNADSNIVQLQIALRKFVPATNAGPAVWLDGTSHIGDTNYYRALQKHLDSQTVVLFEGVNAESHPRRVLKPGASLPATNPPPISMKSTNAGYSMQATLAKSLGLVFQLDAIDYDRTNFLNSDLSVLEIQRLMLNDPTAELAAPGEETESNGSFDALLQIMDGSSFIGSIFKWIVKFIGTEPRLQATTRYMFVEMLGGIKGDFAEVRGLPPDMQHLLKVLIEARNQNVLDDLKTEFTTVPATGSIAVFYGTGHMADLEKRLVRQLHYKSDTEIWLTAFSVDLRDTGLSPTQVEWLRNLIKAQLDQMQPAAAGDGK